MRSLLLFGIVSLGALGSCLVDFDDFEFGSHLPPGVGGATATASTGGSSISIGGSAPASSGGATASSGVGGATCGEEVTPPDHSRCPGECTGGCDGDNRICRIDCDGTGACGTSTIACPTGFACEVSCEGPSACGNATIHCPATYRCDVLCEGNNSCLGLDVICSADGICALDCENSPGTCRGATLACGNNACTADCMGAAATPAVQCGPSCDCNQC
jgi:hypothetical protein